MSEDRFPSHALPKNWQDALDRPPVPIREAWAFLILVACVLAMAVCLIVSPTL